MELIYVGAIIGFVLGASGYIIIRFWLIPISRYRKIKKQIVSDLIAYLNALNTEETGDVKKQLIKGKTEKVRRHAADLPSNYNNDLPHWYKLLLNNRKEFPLEASMHLMVLSNTDHYEHAEKRAEKIKQYLRIG